MSDQNNTLNRRSFLKGAAAVGTSLAFPTIVPASARGKNGTVAPSNRIVMGCIGVGGQGTSDMKGFMTNPDVQVLAVCDVDRTHMEAAQALVNKTQNSNSCLAYGDFRELTARTDIDAVTVVTPDHWHTLVALDAMRNGKDCYVEKPLTLTIEEGRVLRDEARRLGRVVQTGSQQRSGANFRFACELVRNGRIGKLQRVLVGIPGNNKFCPSWQPEPVPAELNYDLWLGQAPDEPYTTMRCHYSFRFILDYSGGQVTNWGAHHLDIAQWGMGMDDSGPIEITGHGEYPPEGLFTTASKVHFECLYESGVRLTCATGGSEDDTGLNAKSGTTFIGSEGTIHVNRGVLLAKPEKILRETIGENEINLYRSRDHFRNFLDCVNNRTAPVADVGIGHRSATICHLGNIAMFLGRKVQWDPKVERFVGDDVANRMVSRAMRAPWRLV